MALQTDIGNRIPEGVVRLSEKEALKYQRSVITDWPSELEVSFLRYGGQIAGLCSSITSAVIINYFKNYLRIGLKTYLLTALPCVVGSGVMSSFFTETILTKNILLMKMSCPICYQMKFGLTQFYMGIGFPAMYTYISFAHAAMITKSYPLPNINTHAREFWKVSYGIFKEGATRFHAAGLIHCLVVLFLPYLQNKQLLTVMSKMQEKEKAMEEL